VFTTTLLKAVQASQSIFIDHNMEGVLLDAEVTTDTSIIVFKLGDQQVTADPAQEIQVYSGGMAYFLDREGAKHEAEFTVVVETPLREDHIK
jgi:hypothetical protein